MYKINELIEKIKIDTNNNKDIIYREKVIHKKKIAIIFNEPLTSSNKISDFIIRSLNGISYLDIKKNKLLDAIKNNISNFKYKEITKSEDIFSYLHRGFTLILIDNESVILALET